jgi:putative endonuclease
MSTDPRHRLGAAGETHAADHLRRMGFTIVERNARTQAGELDLVACNGTTLVFAEVKTRRAGRWSDPFEQLHPVKQQRVRGAARAWLASDRERPFARELRFDAIGVTIDAEGRLISLSHLEGAFLSEVRSSRCKRVPARRQGAWRALHAGDR